MSPGSPPAARAGARLRRHAFTGVEREKPLVCHKVNNVRRGNKRSKTTDRCMFQQFKKLTSNRFVRQI